MRTSILLTLLILLGASSAFTQDLSYAKEVVQTLASPAFYGRGYVAKGDKIAADFIHDQFTEIGLRSFKKNYFQPFTTPVNTFPGEMQLALNGKQKTAGVDYLIDPGSPGIKGKFETVYLPADEMLAQAKLLPVLRNSTGKFIIIPTYDPNAFSKDQQKQISDVISFIKYHPDNPAAGSIVLTEGKLTWSGSTYQYPKPSFTLKVDSTTDIIQRITINVANDFIDKYKSQNVIGYVEGKQADSLVVLIAHYDHLGMMGSETRFPGANDNASGIALLLDLAKHYTSNQPQYNTVFIAFGGEELGLLGAKHFVQNPLFDLSKIKFLLNFDISGTGDDGIQVVNGSVYKDRFDQLVQINEEQKLMKEVKIRGEACNSDHCMFHMQKVPCFFIYTLGGIQAYHDIYDKSETLPLTEYEDYFKLITQFVDGL